MKEMRLFLLLIVLMITVLTACTKPVSKHRVEDSADYKKAESFLNTQNDSAFYYFNKAATASKQPWEVALAYNQMAVIQSDAGDYFGSQESLSSSLKYLDPKKPDDHSCLASDYNELGLTSITLKHYSVAIDYFNQALKFTTDTGLRLSILNNKGLCYRRKGAYKQALKISQSALVQAVNKKTYARILTNIATTKRLSNPAYNAAPELRKALQIRTTEKDRWGQNSSYLHLADYYLSNRPDSALFYAKSMLATAIELQSPDDRLEALKRLISLTENPKAVRGYFLQFTKLSDSVVTARNAAKNQFALIRYEVEKHKVDNLNLQKDNAEKKYEIILQRLLLTITIVFTIGGGIIAVLWYKKRRQKLEQVAQNAIRDGKLKTSKKVHDVVANGLYQVMTEIENQDEIDKEGILDRIEVLYEKSRDISYEEQSPQEANFREKINKMLMSYGSNVRRVSLVGNEEDLWDQVAPNVKHELTHILQELMINMSKHSQAANVVVKFEQIVHEVNIYYTDDGIGIEGEPNLKNGLTSTGNRIGSIGGAITFDTKTERGLKVNISFPIT